MSWVTGWFKTSVNVLLTICWVPIPPENQCWHYLKSNRLFCMHPQFYPLNYKDSCYCYIAETFLVSFSPPKFVQVPDCPDQQNVEKKGVGMVGWGLPNCLFGWTILECMGSPTQDLVTSCSQDWKPVKFELVVHTPQVLYHKYLKTRNLASTKFSIFRRGWGSNFAKISTHIILSQQC